jgi:hypothetical protein
VADEPPTNEYVAECFWPGVDEAAVRALDARAGGCADELARAGEPVRYLGSILMRDDEVVLYLFDGTEDAVRRAAERAGIPFERILEASGSPWQVPKST